MTRETKNILLGVTGGIAAYKSCELVRLLVKQGHQVTVVMTKAATGFIHPETFHALSGQPVFTESLTQQEQTMAHIELTRKSDVFLIAPASANTIAKIANGLCDNLLSNLVAARNCPLAIAPAMNTQMWTNPANQRNVQQLQKDGITLFGPASGELACGETGAGRMLEPSELIDLLPTLWTPKILSGKKVLLTNGATYEAIDPVRGITNISSGRMGQALARACLYAGAEVTVVSGMVKSGISMPVGVHTIPLQSANQMADAVEAKIADTDIFIGVAAVSDFRVANKNAQKIKKTHTDDTISIELTQNPDILATVANLTNPPFCVGFAAESENLLEYAEQKRQRKNLPMLVANLVQSAMNQEDTEITILDHSGATAFDRMSKDQAAQQIVTHIAKLLNERKT